MFVATLLAVLVGVGAGVFAIRAACASLAMDTRNPIAVYRAGYIGAAIATIPAFFASVTIGGTFGGSWSEELAGSSAIPLGAGVGMFIVFVAVIVFAGILTATLARSWVGTADG